MRTERRSVRPLLAAASVFVCLVMSLTLSIRSAGAAPPAQSKLTDVTTGEEKGHVVIAPDARNRNGEFHAEVTVNVHDLEPNTAYQVWRVIDFVPDGVYDPTAPGTGWAQIATITTSSGGAIEAHFIRGGGLFSGDRFDVLIEVRLNDGVTVALQSEVMTITVK
jgi:hypothetical protein